MRSGNEPIFRCRKSSVYILTRDGVAINYFYYERNDDIALKRFGEMGWKTLRKTFIDGLYDAGLIVFKRSAGDFDVFMNGVAINYRKLAGNSGYCGEKRFGEQWPLIVSVWLEGVDLMSMEERLQLFDVNFKHDGVHITTAHDVSETIPWRHAIEYSENGENSMYGILSVVSGDSGLHFVHGCLRDLLFTTEYPIGFKFVYCEKAELFLKFISDEVRAKVEKLSDFHNSIGKHLPTVLSQLTISYLSGKSLLRSVYGD